MSSLPGRKFQEFPDALNRLRCPDMPDLGARLTQDELDALDLGDMVAEVGCTCDWTAIWYAATVHGWQVRVMHNILCDTRADVRAASAWLN